MSQFDESDGFASTRKPNRQGRARLPRPNNNCVEVLRWIG